jgi:hypothetical protein
VIGPRRGGALALAHGSHTHPLVLEAPRQEYGRGGVEKTASRVRFRH